MGLVVDWEIGVRALSEEEKRRLRPARIGGKTSSSSLSSVRDSSSAGTGDEKGEWSGDG